MALFVAKRLLMALATVLVVAVLAFLLVHAMPGSPGAVSLGAGASQDAIDQLNQQPRLERSAVLPSSSAGWATRCRAIWASR